MELPIEMGPKGIGEILSDSVTVLRQNLKAFALASLPICVLELVFREGAGAMLSEFTRDFDPNQPEAIDLAAYTLNFAGYSGLMVATLVTSALLYAVGIGGTHEVLHGRRQPATQLLGAGLAAAPRVLVSGLLFWLLTTLAIGLPGAAVVGIVIAFPSVGLAIGLMVLYAAFATVIMLLLFLRWFLYLHAAVIERKVGPSALARAASLSSSHGLPFSQSPRLRLSILLLVFFAASSAVQSLFAIPMLVHGIGQTPPMSDISLWSMPIWMGVPIGFLQVATSAVLYPFAAVMTTLFYYDLRVRFEGWEIDDEDHA